MHPKSLTIILLLVLASCGPSTPSPTKEKKTDTAQTPLTETHTPQHRETFKEDITDLPLALSQFVLDGYTAIENVTGDLNLDQYPDVIMVLKQNGEDTLSETQENTVKRPLLILIGQPDGSYKLTARNDNVVYCVNCGGMMGDPFMDVVIKKGYFSVEHYGGSAWRWTRVVTFKYAPTEGNWFLHKDGGESFHAAEPDKVETHIKTVKDFGKIAFDKYDIYKED